MTNCSETTAGIWMPSANNPVKTTEFEETIALIERQRMNGVIANIDRVIKDGDAARAECETVTGADYDNVIRPALVAWRNAAVAPQPPRGFVLLRELVQMVMEAKSLGSLKTEVGRRFLPHHSNPPYDTMTADAQTALLSITDAAKAMFKNEGAPLTTPPAKSQQNLKPGWKKIQPPPGYSGWVCGTCGGPVAGRYSTCDNCGCDGRLGA